MESVLIVEAKRIVHLSDAWSGLRDAHDMKATGGRTRGLYIGRTRFCRASQGALRELS